MMEVTVYHGRYGRKKDNPGVQTLHFVSPLTRSRSQCILQLRETQETWKEVKMRSRGGTDISYKGDMIDLK